jgi:hypothetical protein
VPENGGLRAAARVALVAGAAGSIALMMRAGSRQRSILLIVLFAGWVLSPFLALALANLRAARWPPRVRTAVHIAMIAVAALSLTLYGLSAVHTLAKAGFLYLVVPAACWATAAIVVGTAAFASRHEIS